MIAEFFRFIPDNFLTIEKATSQSDEVAFTGADNLQSGFIIPDPIYLLRDFKGFIFCHIGS